MAFEDDLKRRLRRLAQELERGGNDMLPGTAAGRQPPKLRKGAAGLGLAACIAAIVALVSQIVPSDRTGSRDTRPAAAPTAAESPSPSPSPIPTESPEPIPSSPKPAPAPPPPARRQDFDCRNPGPPSAPPSGIRITVEVQTGNVIAHFKNERSTPAHSEQGRPFADFVIYDAEGNLVWTPYPKDAVFTQELRVRDYAPGEEDSESVEWNRNGCGPGGSQDGPRLAAGRYTIRAIWSGNLGGWSAPVSFDVR